MFGNDFRALLQNPGEKVIVFSQFTSLFDLMALVLQNQHIEF